MLYSIDKNEYIREIPYAENYQRWRSRLTEVEYEAIVVELNGLLNGDEIVTSSWIPGNDWSNTVYDPIYQKSCDQNPNESGMCFGLFLWVVIQSHPEVWAFGRYEKDGIPINGLTYFRIDNPPAI